MMILSLCLLKASTAIFTAGTMPGEKAIQPAPPLPQKEGQPVRPPAGGVDYRARKIREELYLVHWIVDKQIHVTLLFDFVNKKTICAALMPGQTELWDVAYWDRWQLPSLALKKYQGKGANKL